MARLKPPFGTTAALTSAVVQERDLAYDTTLDRFVMGDGSAAAGKPLAFLSDVGGAPISSAMTPVVQAASIDAAMELLDQGDFTATGTTYARDLSSRFADQLSAKDFGARGDAVKGFTGVATSSDATFTDSAAAWTSADIGKAIRVNGAGAAGADLATTIASINSATSIELTVAASTTVASNCSYVYGTNDTTAVQAWIDACRTYGDIGFAPRGLYLCDALTCGPRVQTSTPCFFGAGSNTTRFIKLTNNTSPLLTINSEAATTYFAGTTFDGLAFESRSLGPAIRMYSVVRSVFRDIEATGGSIGVEQLGGIGVAYDSPAFHANGTNLKIRKYTASVGTGYPNLTSIHQGYITDGTALGLDFDDGKSVHIYGTNIENNGTTAVSNNGNVYVGTAVGSEDSVEAYGVIMFGGWLEAADGDAAVICRSGLNIFVGVDVAANTSTYDFDMRGGRYVLRDLTGPTSKTTSVLEGGSIGSPNYIENVKLGGALSVDQSKTLVTGSSTQTAAIDLIDKAGTDVASATTTNIGAALGGYINITGTTTITGFGTVTAGVRRKVKFTGALTLTHNGTSLILPGAANITTAANDTAEFASLGSGNWVCLWYKRASGQPVATVALSSGGTGVGSSNHNVAQMLFVAAGVDMNSANTDTAIPITLPTGYTRFIVNAVRVWGASGTLNVATCGVFTAAAAGGTAIVGAGSTFTITTASEGTNNNALQFNATNSTTQSYLLATVPNIYFRVGTAQGSATTANVGILISPLL